MHNIYYLLLILIVSLKNIICLFYHTRMNEVTRKKIKDKCVLSVIIQLITNVKLQEAPKVIVL